jgi:hypothetical protein
LLGEARRLPQLSFEPVHPVLRRLELLRRLPELSAQLFRLLPRRRQLIPARRLLQLSFEAVHPIL